MTAPDVWQDMEFLTRMKSDLEVPPVHGDDIFLAGTMAAFSTPYRTYPRDPHWIVWATVIACVLAALSLAGILWWNLRG